MTHPHWQEKYTQLIERMKAVTAIARMLLVSVWHILTKKEVDRHAIPEKVLSYFMEHCYDLFGDGAKSIKASWDECQ